MTEIIEGGEIRDTPLAEALGERYLSYALSTIMSRSLPDVRDGIRCTGASSMPCGSSS